MANPPLVWRCSPSPASCGASTQVRRRFTNKHNGGRPRMSLALAGNGVIPSFHLIFFFFSPEGQWIGMMNGVAHVRHVVGLSLLVAPPHRTTATINNTTYMLYLGAICYTSRFMAMDCRTAP